MRIIERRGAAADHFDYLDDGPEGVADEDLAGADPAEAIDTDAPADAQSATATSVPARAEA